MKAAEDIVKNFKGNATAWRKTERGKSENKNNKDFYKATVYFSSGCMCLAWATSIVLKKENPALLDYKSDDSIMDHINSCFRTNIWSDFPTAPIKNSKSTYSEIKRKD